MALNPFFLQGSPSEQRLVQELIDEHLKIFGIDVYYLPRKMIETDDVLGEVQSSKFNDAYVLEAYLNNYEGYAKGSDIMTKFGVNLENEITLVTGASRGIGAVIEKLFGQSGSYVLGTTTTQNGADSICMNILIYTPNKKLKAPVFLAR